MGDLGNFGGLEDYKNARDSWLSSAGMNHRTINLLTFLEYESAGNTANPNEVFRRTKYSKRLDHVWLSFIKVFDTVKGGYITTGDIDVISEFPILGFANSYKNSNGVVIPQYGGDLIEWNRGVWEVSDVLEPVQFGYQSGAVWYHTVMRRANLSGQGIVVTS